MASLATPGDVLYEMVRADKRLGGQGLGMLHAIRARLLERNLLTVHMAPSSIEALLDETVDEISARQEAEERKAESFVSH